MNNFSEIVKKFSVYVDTKLTETVTAEELHDTITFWLQFVNHERIIVKESR